MLTRGNFRHGDDSIIPAFRCRPSNEILRRIRAGWATSSHRIPGRPPEVEHGRHEVLTTVTLREHADLRLGEQVPSIDGHANMHPDAVVIGSVTIGPDSSVWPCAVLRGDDGEIRIGAASSVQDGSVLHTTPDHPTVVGDRCVIGHIVHLEGCTIHDEVLVGNGSIVLHRVVVESGSIVAANSVVLNDTLVPSGALAAGSPAVVKPGRARTDFIADGVQSYVERGRRFRADLRRID